MITKKSNITESSHSTQDVFIPRIVKDKNNPNFLSVYINYPTGAGALTALGKETSSGQQRKEGVEKAMKIAQLVSSKLKSKYNIEDISITDLENGKIQIFAVSDDFVDIPIYNPKISLNENLEDLKKRIKKLVPDVYKKVKKTENAAIEFDELAKFPKLKQVIVNLLTSDFSFFLSSIDWVSPRPTTFRINLKNDQSFYLIYTDLSWIAQIEGKKYYMLNLPEEQHAAEALSRILRYGLGKIEGDGESEDEDNSSGGSSSSSSDFEEFEADDSVDDDTSTSDEIE